ncbi:hypothetical protein BDV11DRAFT_194930 [Aspergillus similis]
MLTIPASGFWTVSYVARATLPNSPAMAIIRPRLARPMPAAIPSPTMGTNCLVSTRTLLNIEGWDRGAYHKHNPKNKQNEALLPLPLLILLLCLLLQRAYLLRLRHTINRLLQHKDDWHIRQSRIPWITTCPSAAHNLH